MEPELHTREAHDAITAELVACTLGQAHRPELMVGMAGVAAQLGAAVRAFGDALRKALG